MKEIYSTRLSGKVAQFVEEEAEKMKWTPSFTINQLLTELIELKKNSEQVA